MRSADIIRLIMKLKGIKHQELADMIGIKRELVTMRLKPNGSLSIRIASQMLKPLGYKVLFVSNDDYEIYEVDE